MGMENVQRGRLQEVKDCVVSQSRPRLSGGHLLKYKEDDTDTNESESDSCRVRMKTKEVHDPKSRRSRTFLTGCEVSRAIVRT